MIKKRKTWQEKLAYHMALGRDGSGHLFSLFRLFSHPEEIVIPPNETGKFQKSQFQIRTLP